MSIIVVGFVIMLYIVIFGLAVADYVLKSLALHTLAKRRGINNPWLAWIPVVSDWITGRLADEIDSQNGFNRKWGSTLLGLSMAVVAGVVFSYALIMVVAFVAMAAMYMQEVYIAFVILVYVLIILMSVLSMAHALIDAICMYKIFESTVHEKTVKYLVLYFIVPLAGAICLNKCKNKGYPEASVEDMAIFPDVTDNQEPSD